MKIYKYEYADDVEHEDRSWEYQGLICNQLFLWNKYNRKPELTKPVKEDKLLLICPI